MGIWLALGTALSTDDVKNELLFKVLHFVLIQLNLRITKMKTSTNHFSVKLRSLLFTILFDFITLTQNSNISYFEQKSVQSVAKCDKV